MRQKLIVLLLVPVVLLPVVVITAGGDLEVVWQELQAFWRLPLEVALYAQQPSPTATFGASPTVTFPPSPTLTFPPSPTLTFGPSPTPFDPRRAAPLLTRWATMSLSIVLALVALWFLSRPNKDSHT